MQLASSAFDKSMRQEFRNRGYIKVSIGVINSDAQNNAEIYDAELTYFSDKKKPFDGYKVSQVYATAEQDFSKVDGSMYFLPEENAGMMYYNNGIITEGLLGRVWISFNGLVGLDIKGLTIDFGEYYPTHFTIRTDSGVKNYENNSRLFMTEDAFDGTSYFIITPITMVNGQGRLRIYEFICGISNTFSNEKVLSYSAKEFVSPVSESIPSMDTTIVVDNQDLYYRVDNPESAIAYMEVGQEVKVTFGYDITGYEDIEWLNETTTYLNTWSANDTQAEFTSVDRFYQLDEIYYGGLYRLEGITLYDLAIEVLNSAGITDSREYYLDSYLKKIIVYNPIPAVKHSEALQIIANAGRCVLYEDRQNRIHMKSSFIPEMVATSGDKTEYSNMENLLKNAEKKAYAVCSNDFTQVNGTMYFMPQNQESYFSDTGYVSNSISDENGNFESNPKITINLETGFVAYGLRMDFRSVSPEQFKITTYFEDVFLHEITVDNSGLEYITDERFENFDKMEIEFTKGHPNSRIFVDNILVGDVTNYVLSRDTELMESPTGERQKKIKNISIMRTNYSASKGEIRELKSEEILVSDLGEMHDYTIYFSSPSYGYVASIKDNSKLSAFIIDYSDYYVHVGLAGTATESKINIVISGYEYEVTGTQYRKQHNVNGQEVVWDNPLISTIEHAKDLEEWLATYYLGDVDYEIKWRGDPRAEANDLFYLELKDRDLALIRSYENDLEFDGAWSGIMKARKVVMAWQ